VESLGDVIAESSIYRSAAWGVEDQPDFYNQVMLTKTKYDAETTLQICQQIENTLGRIRNEKWGARIIDIDVLYFNMDIIDTTTLKVPHPYLHLRRFTLLPLCEIANNFRHPILGQTNAELLQHCLDPLSVIKI
jgi:2-amino-4-hydroxy-6-hydroxymethyldihydropteridine diphosphokinase